MGAKLHLGCGTRRLEGYISIDSRSEVKPDIVADITNLSALGLEGVSEIYACHVIEHLKKPGAVLLHWNDVLEYHGVLRLSVPDMLVMSLAYVNYQVSLNRLSGLIWGRQDYKGNRHLHGWDFETLASLLRECNFYDVRQWSPDCLFPSGYHDFSYAKIYTQTNKEFSVSLNVEAKKI